MTKQLKKSSIVNESKIKSNPFYKYFSERVNSENASNDILTIPNAISLFRLIIIPFAFMCIINYFDLIGIALLIIASLSDYLDGYIARKYKQITKLGKILDPVADRFFIFFMLLAMLVRELIPTWFVLLIIMREVILFFVYAITIVSKNTIPDVKYIGKIGAASLMVGLPIYFVMWTLYSNRVFGVSADGTFLVLNMIIFVLLCIALGIYYYAGIQYVLEIVQELYKDNKLSFYFTIIFSALITVVFLVYIFRSIQLPI